MQDAYLVGLAGKDAEISMLREQLAQLSSDLTRNLAVSGCHSCTSITAASVQVPQ